MKGYRAGRVALLAVLLSGLASVAFGNAPVEAVGLFKDRAMIRVLGAEHYLTVGQTSPEGATLVESDAQHALVRYKGETYKLTLSDRVGGTFLAPTNATLSIAPDQIGQYRAQGTINGHDRGFPGRYRRIARCDQRTYREGDGSANTPIHPSGRRWSPRRARSIRIWWISKRSRSAVSKPTMFALR